MMKLDVGCGVNKKENFFGVDVIRTKVTDIIADAANLPFKDYCADSIYSRRCIQHVKDDFKALKEMYRVLKMGGKLQLIVASVYGFLFYKLGFSESSGKYEVFHFYSNKKLRKMLEKVGFTKINILKVKSVRKIGYDLMAICEK